MFACSAIAAAIAFCYFFVYFFHSPYLVVKIICRSLLQETFVIEDLLYYDSCTSEQQLWNSNYSDMIYEYSDDGMCFYSNHASDNILTAKYNLPSDYIAEFTYNGGDKYQLSMYFSDSFIQTDFNATYYEIFLHYGDSGTRINRSISVGDVFKVVKQGTSITYYQNDVQVFTGTLPSPNNELRRYSWHNKPSRYTIIKDIKIKAL